MAFLLHFAATVICTSGSFSSMTRNSTIFEMSTVGPDIFLGELLYLQWVPRDVMLLCYCYGTLNSNDIGMWSMSRGDKLLSYLSPNISLSEKS